MYKNYMKEQSELFKFLEELNKQTCKSVKMNLCFNNVDFGVGAQYTKDKNLIELNTHNANKKILIHEFAHSFYLKHNLNFLFVQSILQYYYFKNIDFSMYDYHEDEKIDFIEFDDYRFKKVVVLIFDFSKDLEDLLDYSAIAVNDIYNKGKESKFSPYH